MKTYGVRGAQALCPHCGKPWAPLCPECGKGGTFLNSRKSAGGLHYKRYECENGHRFSTLPDGKVAPRFMTDPAVPVVTDDAAGKP